MVVMQKRSKRKPSGGRYKNLKVKRKAQMGSLPTFTKVDEQPKRKTVRVLGGNIKHRLQKANSVNLLDKKSNKCQLAF